MSVLGSLGRSLRRSFDFRGRSSRRDYWIYVAAVVALLIPMGPLADAGASDWVFGPLVGAWFLLLPGFVAVTVRRLHDVGIPGLYSALMVFQPIGLLFVLWVGIQRGQPHPNGYGLEPTGDDVPKQPIRFGQIVRFIGRAWLVVAGAAVLLGHLHILYRDGLARLIDVLSPFNVWNYLSILLAILPGVLCLRLADKIDQRSGGS